VSDRHVNISETLTFIPVDNLIHFHKNTRSLSRTEPGVDLAEDVFTGVRLTILPVVGLVDLVLGVDCSLGAMINADGNEV
jgi:hypothetical protein